MCNKTLVNNRVEECYIIAEQRYNREFPRPTVRFAKRGTTAGTANYGKNELNFNMVLLNENVEHFVQHTVAHEISHLITGIVYPETNCRFKHGKRVKRSPHGTAWASVMAVLGVDAKRCHSYNTSNSKRRQSDTHDYECSTCKSVMQMSAIRHRRMATGVTTYSHAKCKDSELKYIGMTKYNK